MPRLIKKVDASTIPTARSVSEIAAGLIVGITLSNFCLAGLNDHDWMAALDHSLSNAVGITVLAWVIRRLLKRIVYIA